MASTKTETKPVTAKAEPRTEEQFLADREKDIRKKHRRVLPGTIRREVDGHHAGKLTVEMKCQNGSCEAIRRVATSDLFQVRFCQECTVTLRNKKRRAKAVAARKAATPTPGDANGDAGGNSGSGGDGGAKATKEAKVRKPRRKRQEVPSLASSNGAAHGVLPDTDTDSEVGTEEGSEVGADTGDSFPELPTTQMEEAPVVGVS